MGAKACPPGHQQSAVVMCGLVCDRAIVRVLPASGMMSFCPSLRYVRVARRIHAIIPAALAHRTRSRAALARGVRGAPVVFFCVRNCGTGLEISYPAAPATAHQRLEQAKRLHHRQPSGCTPISLPALPRTHPSAPSRAPPSPPYDRSHSYAGAGWDPRGGWPNTIGCSTEAVVSPHRTARPAKKLAQEAPGAALPVRLAYATPTEHRQIYAYLLAKPHSTRSSLGSNLPRGCNRSRASLWGLPHSGAPMTGHQGAAAERGRRITAAALLACCLLGELPMAGRTDGLPRRLGAPGRPGRVAVAASYAGVPPSLAAPRTAPHRTAGVNFRLPPTSAGVAQAATDCRAVRLGAASAASGFTHY